MSVSLRSAKGLEIIQLIREKAPCNDVLSLCKADREMETTCKDAYPHIRSKSEPPTFQEYARTCDFKTKLVERFVALCDAKIRMAGIVWDDLGLRRRPKSLEQNLSGVIPSRVMRLCISFDYVHGDAIGETVESIRQERLRFAFVMDGYSLVHAVADVEVIKMEQLDSDARSLVVTFNIKRREGAPKAACASRGVVTMFLRRNIPNTNAPGPSQTRPLFLMVPIVFEKRPILFTDRSRVHRRSYFSYLNHVLQPRRWCFHTYVSDIVSSEVKSKYRDEMRKATTILYQAVLAHGFVAGGILLRCVHRQDVSSGKDVDVYMNQTGFVAFLKSLNLHKWHVWRLLQMEATIKYIYSGMASNVQGIHYHVTLIVPPIQQAIDVVVSVDPLESVKNFDFTFCQMAIRPKRSKAWPPRETDAESVVLYHPSDSMSKRGYLTRPFVREYALGNKTTNNRIKKYASRGFEILMKTEDIAAVEQETGRPVPMRAPNSFFHNERFNENRLAVPAGVRTLRAVTCLIGMSKGPNGLLWVARHYMGDDEPQKAIDYLVKVVHKYPSLMQNTVFNLGALINPVTMQVVDRAPFEWSVVQN